MMQVRRSDFQTLITVAICLAAAIAICGANLVSLATAGEADIVDVQAEIQDDGTWRFDVTVAHDDVDWNHYADRWDVLSPNGVILGERVLLHPHVNEQPFTRSLRGVSIPEFVDRVTVRAHDSIHKLGGREFVAELQR